MAPRSVVIVYVATMQQFRLNQYRGPARHPTCPCPTLLNPQLLTGTARGPCSIARIDHGEDPEYLVDPEESPVNETQSQCLVFRL